MGAAWQPAALAGKTNSRSLQTALREWTAGLFLGPPGVAAAMRLPPASASAPARPRTRTAYEIAQGQYRKPDSSSSGVKLTKKSLDDCVDDVAWPGLERVASGRSLPPPRTAAEIALTTRLSAQTLALCLWVWREEAELRGATWWLRRQTCFFKLRLATLQAAARQSSSRQRVPLPVVDVSRRTRAMTLGRWRRNAAMRRASAAHAISLANTVLRASPRGCRTPSVRSEATLRSSVRSAALTERGVAAHAAHLCGGGCLTLAVLVAGVARGVEQGFWRLHALSRVGKHLRATAATLARRRSRRRARHAMHQWRLERRREHAAHSLWLLAVEVVLERALASWRRRALEATRARSVPLQLALAPWARGVRELWRTQLRRSWRRWRRRHRTDAPGLRRQRLAVAAARRLRKRRALRTLEAGAAADALCARRWRAVESIALRRLCRASLRRWLERAERRLGLAQHWFSRLALFWLVGQMALALRAWADHCARDAPLWRCSTYAGVRARQRRGLRRWQDTCRDARDGRRRDESRRVMLLAAERFGLQAVLRGWTAWHQLWRRRQEPLAEPAEAALASPPLLLPRRLSKAAQSMAAAYGSPQRSPLSPRLGFSRPSPGRRWSFTLPDAAAAPPDGDDDAAATSGAAVAPFEEMD